LARTRRAEEEARERERREQEEVERAQREFDEARKKRALSESRRPVSRRASDPTRWQHGKIVTAQCAIRRWLARKQLQRLRTWSPSRP
jgi:hypothetical protein